MNVIDLDNHLINWNLTGYISKGKLLNKSSLHLRARQLIVKQYPTLQILEEVPIPLRKSETLYLDFYLPLIKTCVEVHGEQHFKFVGFYHSTILNFLKAKKRDQEKQEWCEKNDIKYIVLAYNESVSEWEDLIRHDKNS